MTKIVVLDLNGFFIRDNNHPWLQVSVVNFLESLQRKEVIIAGVMDSFARSYLEKIQIMNFFSIISESIKGVLDEIQKSSRYQSGQIYQIEKSTNGSITITNQSSQDLNVPDIVLGKMAIIEFVTR